MLCDLCGRPEESHPCITDFTKLLEQRNKLQLKVDEFRKLLLQWMEASNEAKDITFTHIAKRTEFSLSTEQPPSAPWTDEQKAAVAEVADVMLKGLSQKKQGE